MKAAAVVGLLFLAGAIWNFAATDGKVSEGSAALAISVLLLAFHFYVKHETAKEEEFLAWLLTNDQSIRSVGANYGGVRITPSTVVVRYQAALSCLIYSFKASSRSYVVGQHSAMLASAIFSGFSLVFGWWGFPWGPVFTFQALKNNLTRGGRSSVGDLLARLSATSSASTPSSPAPVQSSPRTGV